MLGCFTLQKIYGREPESFEVINRLFHEILADYCAGHVIMAFKQWLKASPEFPTPADIIKRVEIIAYEQSLPKESPPSNDSSLSLEHVRRLDSIGMPLSYAQLDVLQKAIG